VTREGRVLALVSTASAVSGLDLSLMFVAYPSIRQDFSDVPLSLVSWVLTSFTIVAAALLIPAGRIADRVGRKKIFLTSLVFFSLGSGMCAVAPTVPVLIGARVVQAIGGAMLTPSALAIIMTTIPVERRAWAVGVWSTVTGVLATAAPTIGAMLVRYASWRWAFLINVPIGTVCFFIGRRVLEESTDPDAGPLPDPVGVVAIMGAIAALAYGIVQSSAWGWTDRGTLVVFAVSVALLGLFLVRCARHPAPVIDLHVFRPFLFKANALAAVALGATLWGGYYVFIQFLTLGWGFTIVATGLLLLPMTVVSSAISIPAGRLMDTHGHRVLMVPAALVFTASMLWLGLRAGDERAVLTLWIPALAGVGITNAICFSGVNSAALRVAPPGALGITAGIIQTLIRIGGAIGSALGIALVGDRAIGEPASHFRSSFLALGALALLAAACALPLATSPAALAARAGHDARRRSAPDPAGRDATARDAPGSLPAS
jgi:EmrB/QacA subfamily drug resistance transporter